MNLSTITPMILAYNEQDNLRATLAGLSWAKEILLVDSYSTDGTLAIAKEFEQVRIVQRAFDHFADQCNFGLLHVRTPWVLSIDADYRCNEEFTTELSQLDGEKSGYSARFLYGIYGQPLRATLYPARIVLYRADLAQYLRDGHAHHVKITGDIGNIKTPILHDDWKPLRSWMKSQLNYAESEADKLESAKALGWKDRIRRKIVFAPLLTLVYCLFIKRLVLDGWPGIFYTLQRVFAELTLSLVLLDRKIRE